MDNTQQPEPEPEPEPKSKRPRKRQPKRFVPKQKRRRLAPAANTKFGKDELKILKQQQRAVGRKCGICNVKFTSNGPFRRHCVSLSCLHPELRVNQDELENQVSYC